MRRHFGEEEKLSRSQWETERLELLWRGEVPRLAVFRLGQVLNANRGIDLAGKDRIERRASMRIDDLVLPRNELDSPVLFILRVDGDEAGDDETG